jgi:hypothetical protein
VQEKMNMNDDAASFIADWVHDHVRPSGRALTRADLDACCAAYVGPQPRHPPNLSDLPFDQFHAAMVKDLEHAARRAAWVAAAQRVIPQQEVR